MENMGVHGLQILEKGDKEGDHGTRFLDSEKEDEEGGCDR